MTPLARKIIVPSLLLLVGVGFWVLLDGSLQETPWKVLLAALCVAAVPRLHRPVFRWLQRGRRPAPRTRAAVAGAIFITAAAYLTFTAVHQHRPLFPQYHDAQSYAIGTRMMALGRLWLPAHEQADFFETFHVIVKPVYCSMYFPGTAMMLAPGVWLGLAVWVFPLLVSAAAVAMVYRVLAELVDGVAGVVAALWMVSLMWFRHLSIMPMSQTVMLLLGMAMVWAWLGWRRDRRGRWAVLIGIFSGWAAITRPADAVCYAAPVGLAILLALRNMPLIDWLKTGGLIVASAAPFLAVQLLFNWGVSGNVWTTPFRVSMDREAPQFSFGFHQFDPTVLPDSALPQKLLYHVTFSAKMIRAHRPDALGDTWFNLQTGRLRTLLGNGMPTLLLLPFTLAGVLGLRSRGRWVLAVTVPLFCIFYVFYAAMLPHYTVVLAPALIMLTIQGGKVLEGTWVPMRPAIAPFVCISVLGLSVTALPEITRWSTDDQPQETLVDANVTIPKAVQRPALVLVRFRENDDVHDEPVYNWRAARIDDNSIVFAHDLGRRNVQLLAYYARRQPQRHVYYYDRHSRLLQPRGTVVEELRRYVGPVNP